jgi:N-glycosyltransferase
LLTGLPIFSHIVPALIPLAEALRAHGHDVAVASGRSMAGPVRAHGLRFVELPGVGNHAELLADTELAAIPHPATLVGLDQTPAEADHDFRVMFAGPLARLSMTGVLAATAHWRPDLVVGESLEYGGYLAAAELGVPHAVLDTAPLMPLAHPALPRWLDELRIACGLPPADGAGRHGGLFRAGLLPRCWYPDALDGPALRVYQPPDKPTTQPADGPDATGLGPSAAGATGATASGEPFVLVTMGSVAPELLNGHRRIFDALLAALGELGVTAVVALGSGQTLAGWTGVRPANVRLVDFAPQRRLLAASSAFVTHAGFSGVREALLAGVPMLTLPLFGDQHPNAARVVALGAGLGVRAADLTARTAAAALRRLLDEASFRDAARRLRRLGQDLPGFDQLVLDLATLVR